jgi:hypothetical protein
LLLVMFRFSRTAVARVSDDYYPRDPASSTPHIGACAFNSLYLGALVQPDWDMFQSAHPAGERTTGTDGRRGGRWRIVLCRYQVAWIRRGAMCSIGIQVGAPAYCCAMKLTKGCVMR